MSLIDLSNLSEPATTLIKKVSNAAGVLFEPRQVRRIAKAKADAAFLNAKTQIRITDLHRRAARRWIEEEAQHQENMEELTARAVPELTEGADPGAMDNDWIANFFGKSRIVSDSEMQQLWARILAGEANSPGSYSKRTVNLLADLDKVDTTLFSALCGFNWTLGVLVPLVFDPKASVYMNHGINFEALKHLDSAGLVQFDSTAGFSARGVSKSVAVDYYGRPFRLSVPHCCPTNPFPTTPMMDFRSGTSCLQERGRSWHE